jgi:hypothetical protein
MSLQNFSLGKCGKNFPPCRIGSKFSGIGIDGKLFQRVEGCGVTRRRRQLTDREWRWLWEYTRTGSNASQAARVAYGGTPISVRVKGHKKKVKLKPILDRVSAKWNDLTKDVDQIEREVDAYLKRLRRRTVKSEI